MDWLWTLVVGPNHLGYTLLGVILAFSFVAVLSIGGLLVDFLQRRRKNG